MAKEASARRLDNVLGIDPPGAIPQEAYVLGRFRPDQRELVEPALEAAVDAAACWVNHGIIEAMNRFNRRNTASTTRTLQ